MLVLFQTALLALEISVCLLRRGADQCGGSSLDLFQQVHLLLVLEIPEPDAVL